MLALTHVVQKVISKSNAHVVPQVEALLASEDYGKDLASVNNLLKKHQLLEADISAHEVCSIIIIIFLPIAVCVGQPYLQETHNTISEHL